MTKSPSRIIAALVGATVGALIGVFAASNGHIAASLIPVVAIAGAVLGYADCCWRAPSRR